MYFAHTWGPLVPLSEIRARHQFDDRGKLVVLNPTVTGIFQYMIGPTLDTIDLSRISVPVLAIRAIPEAVDDMFLDYDSFDADIKIVAEETFRRWRRVIGDEGQRFVDGVVGARDFPVLGAHHEVHLTEPERILPIIREFLAN